MPVSYFSNTPNKMIISCPTFVLQLLLETRRGDVPDGGCADQRHHVVRDVSRCGGLLLFPAKIPHTQRRVQQRQTSNVGSHGWVRKQMPKKHPKAVRLSFHSSIIFIYKGPQVKIPCCRLLLATCLTHLAYLGCAFLLDCIGRILG